MGWPVYCPVCGADGTTAANQVIADSLKPQLPPDLTLHTGALKSRSTTLTQFAGNRTARRASGQLARGKLGRKWSRLVIVGSTVLVLGLAGASYFQRYQSHKPSEVRVADDGFPHTLPELNAWYIEPPAGQNAATIYLQAFEALQTGNGSKVPLLGQGTLPAPESALPLAEKSAIATVLRANNQALLFLGRGTKYEQSHYPIELARGFEVTLPHLPRFRNAALLLELASVLHGEAHQGKEAANDVLSILALGRSLALEPCLMSQYSRAASISTAVASWEQTLNRTEVPKDSLSELMNLFGKLEAFEARGEGVSRGLAAERAIWTALLANPPKLIEVLSLPGVKIAAEEREQTFARLQKGAELKTEKAQLDEIFTQLMDARKLPFPARLKADACIERQIAEAAARKLPVLEALLQGFAGQSAREAQSLARLRLGMAAVALEQFHIAHGNYPNEASQLTPEYLPETILDPFDGESIRYRKDGAGFELHSVGSKLNDPNPGQRPNRKESGITFAVRRHGELARTHETGP
jgi:hypothetical protein